MNPEIYTVEHHKIPPEKIDQDAFYVIEKLRQSGHKAYLVGGGVRDLLLNVQPKDFDVSTSASPEEIRRVFRNAILIGRRFRLAHVRFGRKVIEVSTFRSGDTESNELIVRDNEWGSEEEDVMRRDFTINGLFYDPHRELVIDYVEGYRDLERKLLRTIGQPDLRFAQDPVRMIRLIKFCARFQLEIEPTTFEALLSCRQEIIKSSSARVLEELLRMLESGSSKKFFHLLQEYGLIMPLLPELAYFLKNKDLDSANFDLLSAIDQEVLKREQPPMDRAILLAALLFPLFDQYLKESLRSGEKAPHLGQIGTAALHVIDCVFSPFFALPRRLRGVTAFVLASQYRFTPLGESLGDKIERKLRLPKDLLTPFALRLFKCRSIATPALAPLYTLWVEKALYSAEADHSLETSTAIHEEREKFRRPRRQRH